MRSNERWWGSHKRRSVLADRGIREEVPVILENCLLGFGESVEISTDLGDHLRRDFLGVPEVVARVVAGARTSDAPVGAVHHVVDETGDEPALPYRARLIVEESGVTPQTREQALVRLKIESPAAVGREHDRVCLPDRLEPE